jgi:1-acyl-sn-glycerol-3-phosphate acyltransferase
MNHTVDIQRSEELIARVGEAVGPLVKTYFAARIRGIEHLPEGPGLFVGNHSGGMSTPDSFLLCHEILKARGVDDVPYGLAHDTVLALPAIGDLVRRMGGVNASHEAAEALFARGKKVLVYPGGDIDAFRPSHQTDRVKFGGRKGYARLAIEHQVPIIPVAAVGGHSGFLVLGDLIPLLRRLGLDEPLRVKTWPVTLSIPWGLLPAPCPPYLPWPTRIFIDVLPPMRPPKDLSGLEPFDRAVRNALQTRVDALTYERKKAGPRPFGDWIRRRR